MLGFWLCGSCFGWFWCWCVCVWNQNDQSLELIIDQWGYLWWLFSRCSVVFPPQKNHSSVDLSTPIYANVSSLKKPSFPPISSPSSLPPEHPPVLEELSPTSTLNPEDECQVKKLWCFKRQLQETRILKFSLLEKSESPWTQLPYCRSGLLWPGWREAVSCPRGNWPSWPHSHTSDGHGPVHWLAALPLFLPGRNKISDKVSIRK